MDPWKGVNHRAVRLFTWETGACSGLLTHVWVEVNHKAENISELMTTARTISSPSLAPKKSQLFYCAYHDKQFFLMVDLVCFVFSIACKTNTTIAQHSCPKHACRLKSTYFLSIIRKMIKPRVLLDTFCVPFGLMWNSVCVFKPSGKGKRLPEVHCIVSKLGCFNLFAKVSEVHKRPLPPSFMERWKAAAVAEVGRLSELLSLNAASVS